MSGHQPDGEDDEIISEFLDEATESIDRLDVILVELETSPGDVDLVTEAFRLLHSIKGVCGFLGFSVLERLAHRGENLLGALRDGTVSVSEEIATALLSVADAIRENLASIEGRGVEASTDFDPLIARLERLSTSPDRAEKPGFTSSSEKADPETGDGTGLRDGERPLRLGDLLVSANEVARVDVEMAAALQAGGDPRTLGQILIDQGKVTDKAVERALSTQTTNRTETVRVDVALLDRVMNLVGELVLARNQLLGDSPGRTSRELSDPTQRLDAITTELQEQVMKTRMQSIGTVWDKLPRLVRDLAVYFGKEVRLETEGEHTELDRTIIEAIKDPLVHMVRNTVDHGIETPEERIEAGKPEVGLLMLKASHEGGQVTLEITDDGRGIDPDKMRESAVARGLIAVGTARDLTDQQALELVFLPGFTTTKAVSTVSGRGVGMDVVRTNIERISGTIDVSSELGSGTTFKIKIPLTLAIIPTLTVWCEDQRFAIPQHSMQELVWLGASGCGARILNVATSPVCRLRGETLPVVFLAEALGLRSSVRAEQVRALVVLQADKRRFGLVVDRIEDTSEIVVKALGREVKSLPWFSGATIMGDGSISLILDIAGLAQQAGIEQRSTLVGHHPTAGPEPELNPDPGDHGWDQSVLVVRVGPYRVAFALDDVDRLEEFPSSVIGTGVSGKPYVHYRDSVMELVSAADLLGQNRRRRDDPGPGHTVVLAGDGHRIGVMVDSIDEIVPAAACYRSPLSEVDTVVVDGAPLELVDVMSILASRAGAGKRSAPTPTGWPTSADEAPV